MGNEIYQRPQKGLAQACSRSINLAFNELAGGDLDSICFHSGAVRLDENRLILKLLAEEYIIDTARRTITSAAGIAETTDSLIMLHYLIKDRDGLSCPASPITFKELPAAGGYFPSFYKRAVLPVIQRFAASPERLISAAVKLGGTEALPGDVSVGFDALPRVNLTWALWQEDNEFPAEGTVIFDAGISNHLPAEDIAMLCQSIALKLCAMDTADTRGL